MELLLPLLRADFGRVDDYRHIPGEPLPVPIVVFAGRTDRAVSREQSAAWAEHTAAGFTLHELDGGHFFLHDRLTELAALIRADLTAAPTDTRPGTPDAGPDPVRDAGRGTAGAAHRVPLGDTGWSVARRGAADHRVPGRRAGAVRRTQGRRRGRRAAGHRRR
ncbi:thioesterase domain-containing protein [Micromonospora sp. BRA006-A]|nr:thioesterase domain-containing protein [Micromonospora sp. BRA006-A]